MVYRGTAPGIRHIVLAIAIVTAIGAGFCNALAAVLQQSAAKRLTERDRGVTPRQLRELVRQLRWLAGQISDTTAFLLQATALSFGALLLVQPLLVLALPFAVLLRSVVARRRPDARALIGVALCVAGATAFLLAANPAERPRADLAPTAAIGMGVAVAIVLSGCLTLAVLTHGNTRAIGFALAAASLYGVTAGTVKVATTQLSQGALQPLLHWELYAAIVTGIAGVILTQSALKPGALAAPVAVLTLGDPLVGLAIGLLWLGETVSTTPVAVVGQVLGLASVVVGVVVLAHQSRNVAAPVKLRSGHATDR